MAAPDFVPSDPTERTRVYSSPPLRPGGWHAGRPGEITGGQPKGQTLGTTGPDPGYAYKLVRHFADRLQLGDVKRDDAIAGCVALAMKRAGLLGRAPVIHDLTAAFTVYGFLDPDPPSELAELRRQAFAEISSHHHYIERRHVVDRVPDEILIRPHNQIQQLYRSDWTQLLDRDDSTVGDQPEAGDHT